MAARALIAVLAVCALACGSESELRQWCEHIWEIRQDCGGCGVDSQARFVDSCAEAMFELEMTDGHAREAFACAGQAVECPEIRACLQSTRLSINSNGLSVHKF